MFYKKHFLEQCLKSFIVYVCKLLHFFSRVYRKNVSLGFPNTNISKATTVWAVKRRTYLNRPDWGGGHTVPNSCWVLFRPMQTCWAVSAVCLLVVGKCCPEGAPLPRSGHCGSKRQAALSYRENGLLT